MRTSMRGLRNRGVPTTGSRTAVRVCTNGMNQ
jgi:hypothetical protein